MKKQFYTYDQPFFHYRKAPAASMTEPHFHKYYEIYYLFSGKRRYFIENEILDVLPGDMILIPEMMTHRTLPSPDTPVGAMYERFLLSPFREDIPEIFLPLFQTHIYHVPEPMRAEILESFQSLQARQAVSDDYTSYHNHANLVRILCALASLPATEQHAEKPLTQKERLMLEAASFIKENFTRPITLEDIAKKYSYSKEYFSSIFKETTGYGFNEYLNQLRVTYAANLLSQTALPITKVAEMCGYNDSNYFSKVFRKLFGVSPVNFRHTPPSHDFRHMPGHESRPGSRLESFPESRPGKVGR